MSKRVLLLATIITAVLTIKILLFSRIYSQNYVFDELYYVTAAKYIFYKFGLRDTFVPPLTTTLSVINNTIIFNVSVNTPMNGVEVFLGTYNWSNAEHPIFAKLIIGLILQFTNSLIAIRFILMTLSLSVFMIFSYVFISKYGWCGFISLLILVVFDWTLYHFFYLAVLDTFMIMFFMLAIAFTLLNRREAIIFLSLATASKEIGIALAIPFALYYYLKEDIKRSVAHISLPALSLLVSYLLYLFVLPPKELQYAISGLGTILDPFSCTYKYLCLFNVTEEWGIFVFSPIFIWILVPGLIIRLIEDKDDVTLLPYFVAYIYLLTVVIIAMVRSIYIYYYAPIILLSVFSLADIFSYLKTRFFTKVGEHHEKRAKTENCGGRYVQK